MENSNKQAGSAKSADGIWIIIVVVGAFIGYVRYFDLLGKLLKH